MYLPAGTQVGAANRLITAGVDLVEAAQEFGTPLYVYNEELLREKCRAYRGLLPKIYPAGAIAYAGKAFLTAAMCRLVEQEGLCLDVVSGGELAVARRAAFPMERVYFHGNNKSDEELAMAVDWGVGRIVIDNLGELERLEKAAAERRRRVPVLLRITPGVTASTHRYIQTGQVDSKFGFAIPGGQALEAARRALKASHLVLRGLHCHIGSQIMDPRPFCLAAEIMLSLLQEIRRQTGVLLRELNLGGGLGIRYTRDDRVCTIGDFLRLLVRIIREKAAALELPLPALTLEPGRSIAGEAGITLYTIGAVKEVPGIRRYVAVDGGMTDNLRPALYGARYEAALANRTQVNGPLETVTVAGKACESGDILIRDLALPAPSPGDILAVFNTGAYHFAMFSHYNRHLRPAVVFLREGRAELVSRRESYDDLTRLERIPAHLETVPGRASGRESEGCVS